MWAVHDRQGRYFTFGTHQVQWKNGYLQQTGTVSERRVIGVFGDTVVAKLMWPEIAMRLERFYSI